MKLFAKNINQSIIDVINRFPLVLLSITATVTALVMLIESNTSIENQLVKIAMVSSLGILAFLNSRLYKERYNTTHTQYYLANVGILLLLVIYYFFLPENIKNNFSEGIRFAGLMLSLHLIASYIPFFKSRNLKAFTGYNIQVLLRFLESFLFVIVLIATISLAIVAVENLFAVDIITGKRYPQLFTIITGSIGGFYFLSNYPKKFDSLIEINFNKAFGVFSKYILIPIVIIYGLILYAYAIKLGIVQTWPEKWMIKMSNWFFALGILAYLFNYAYNYQTKNRITTLYLKWFFPITLPLALALIIPIYKRFIDEGITEENYTLATIALWVVFVSIYFILSKKDNIKILPISLSIIIFLSVIGPWNMSNLALQSQWHRLESTMLEVGALDQQLNLQKVTKKLTRNDNIVITQSLHYISKRDQLNKFLVWDHNNLLAKEIHQKASVYKILRGLGIKKVSPIQRKLNNNNQYFSFNGNRTYDVNLKSFTYFVPIISDAGLKTPTNYLLLDNNSNKMILVFEDNKSYFDLPNITQMDMSYMTNDDMLSNDLWIQNDTYSILIKFHHIRGRIELNGQRSIDHIEGNAFIKLKNNN